MDESAASQEICDRVPTMSMEQFQLVKVATPRLTTASLGFFSEPINESIVLSRIEIVESSSA